MLHTLREHDAARVATTMTAARQGVGVQGMVPQHAPQRNPSSVPGAAGTLMASN